LWKDKEMAIVDLSRSPQLISDSALMAVCFRRVRNGKVYVGTRGQGAFPRTCVHRDKGRAFPQTLQRMQDCNSPSKNGGFLSSRHACKALLIE
jgi:hypothetical protein